MKRAPIVTKLHKNVTKDTADCAKHYKTSKSHSPGLLTVQCACDSPKLLGFIIMTQAESTALALSSILTHFGVPPRAVFYDNACNLLKSVLIRVPWLLGRTRLAVDRLHYKSHKCSAYFNPDSCRQFDMPRTETAESINARIERSLISVRYVKGDKLMFFCVHCLQCSIFQHRFSKYITERMSRMTILQRSLILCSRVRVTGACD